MKKQSVARPASSQLWSHTLQQLDSDEEVIEQHEAKFDNKLVAADYPMDKEQSMSGIKYSLETRLYATPFSVLTVMIIDWFKCA